MLESKLETNKLRKLVWGIWPTIGFGLIVSIVQLLVQIAVALVYRFVDSISDPDFDSSVFAENLDSDGLFLAIATIVSAVICIGLIVLFVKLRKGITLSEYLGLKPITRKHIFVVIGVFIGLMILAGIASVFIGETEDSEFTTEVYNTSVWPVLFGIAVVVFAPAFEETFFRGFLFAGLRQSPIGTAGAIALTAIMWTLLHLQYEVSGMSVIFTLGIVLGIVRYKTGSLWTVILIHALWNLFAVLGAAAAE
ncbi:lysostaphin resistance A-like protein [Chloroflexota bacterium]